MLPFPRCIYLLIKDDCRGEILPKAGDSSVVELPGQPMGGEREQNWRHRGAPEDPQVKSF